MPPIEDRRDDWQHGVDENLASLNTGQRVNDRLLEDLDANYAALDRLLRGDAEKETDGLIAKIHILETQLSRLNAVVFMDSTGKKGIQHQVQELSEGRSDKRDQWRNWTKIAVALIMSGMLGHFWGPISQLLGLKSVDPLEEKIERAKRPRGKKLYRLTHVKEAPPSDPPASETSSENQE